MWYTTSPFSVTAIVLCCVNFLSYIKFNSKDENIITIYMYIYIHIFMVTATCIGYLAIYIKNKLVHCIPCNEKSSCFITVWELWILMIRVLGERNTLAKAIMGCISCPFVQQTFVMGWDSSKGLLGYISVACQCWEVTHNFIDSLGFFYVFDLCLLYFFVIIIYNLQQICCCRTFPICTFQYAHIYLLRFMIIIDFELKMSDNIAICMDLTG